MPTTSRRFDVNCLTRLLSDGDLVRAGADRFTPVIEARSDGRTPLYEAVILAGGLPASDVAEVVDALIDLGANPWTQQSAAWRHETPWDAALRLGAPPRVLVAMIESPHASRGILAECLGQVEKAMRERPKLTSVWERASVRAVGGLSSPVSGTEPPRYGRPTGPTHGRRGK